jgi:sugar phosphate isomerase/epimerase
MKLGFSTLALFVRSFEHWLQRAEADGFRMIEILCEGPYTWPRNALVLDASELEIFNSYDVEVFLHAPTIDLNPASMNPGIRNETLIQMKETIDMGIQIDAAAITTHPGLIHRLEERVRDMGMRYSIETLQAGNEYAQERGIKLCVENMPNSYAYFCNSSLEHQYFSKKSGCSLTVDMGHANTTGDPESFLKMQNISYYHVSDNDGKRDQHLALGEGTLDLNLLNGIDNLVIELNDYQNVLKSRDVLFSMRKCNRLIK